jgi:DNA primase
VVAVIGRHVELKRSGRTFSGCCPFHGERTPSFHVYPEDRHFKCYGCGEYGDVFKFLQKLQGKEFPEVVRALAAEVGVEIPERAEDGVELRRKRQERTETLGALDAAARYFSARLWSRHGEAARRYLEGRGIAEETIRRFRVGVASTAWQDLVPRLAGKGVRLEALVRSGLVAARERGEPYDRFRGRLVFPIAGLDGEVIGFGGRVMPEVSGAERLAKYINSPESPVYKKSRVLYGIDLAREAIRRTRQAILVEGYFDVVGLHQAGVRNAVAVCGTALTPEHVDVLKRCDCREIVVLFDGDAAGVAALTKSAHAILPSAIGAKVALLPRDAGDVDPDEFARRHGGAAVERLVAEGKALTDFLIDEAVQAHCGSRPREASLEAKRAAYRQLAPFIASLPRGLSRNIFEERTSRALDVNLDALRAELDPAESAAPTAPVMLGAAAPRGPARGKPLAPAGSVPNVATLSAPGLTRLWGPEVDALGLVASFPDLTGIADEERLVDLVPSGPLKSFAEELLAGAQLSAAEVVARLTAVLDPKALRRVEALLGAGRPDRGHAERELRRAILKARIERLEGDYDRLNALVARRGTPVPDDLRTDALTTWRRLADLKERLSLLEKGSTPG